MRLLRLPKVFFDDHRDRDLPTPVVVRETNRHYFVAPNDPALDELRSDAAYYANQYIRRDMHMPELARSADATLDALLYMEVE